MKFSNFQIFHSRRCQISRFYSKTLNFQEFQENESQISRYKGSLPWISWFFSLWLTSNFQILWKLAISFQFLIEIYLRSPDFSGTEQTLNFQIFPKNEPQISRFHGEQTLNFQIFSRNESHISRFFISGDVTVIDIKFPDFMEISNKFPVIYRNRPQISRFHGNKPWVSKFFLRMNLNFPDFQEADHLFLDFLL